MRKDYLSESSLVYSNGQLAMTPAHDLHQGDANLDTTTDVRDFNLWNANKFTSGTDWASGDFNGDGTTDVRDFNLWNANKFTDVNTPAPVAGGQVPEPSTLILLALGAVALGARLRRRRLAA